MNSRFARLSGLCLCPLIAAAPLSTAVAAESPRYTWLGAGYQWTDVNYAIKQEGGEHDGIRLDGSLGLMEIGPFGLHLVADYFDGDFTGIEGPDQDSSSWSLGLGGSYRLRENMDVVLRARYVETELDNVDDDGYSIEAFVLSQISDNLDFEAGFRYSDLDDSDISNNDVFLGLGYALNDWLSFRARGVIFDDDTGFEIGFRAHFAGFLGKDHLF